MGTLLRSCVKVREAIKLPFRVVSGVDCRVRRPIRWGLHMAKGGGHFFFGGGGGRPYYRLHLWHTVSSVCLSSVRRRRLSFHSFVTFCIVAKRYVLANNCLKELIGNQGQKVDFVGRCHISASSYASTATDTAVFALFLPL